MTFIKTFLSVSIFITSFLSSNAQGWLNPSSVWTTYTLRTVDLFHFKEKIQETLERDTIINGHLYYKIRTLGTFESGYDFDNPQFFNTIDEYNGAIREEDNLWLWVPKDSDEEIVLYDFDLAESDSMSIWDIPDQKFKVELLDTIVFDNRERRRYQLPQLGFQFIEGIGLTNGITQKFSEFLNLESLDILCQFENQNETFSINQDSLSQMLSLLSMVDINVDERYCDFTIVSTANPISDKTISLYPNPVNDKLFFESDVNINQVSIFDTHGKRIYAQTVKPNRYHINLSHLPPGFYTIHLSNEKEQFISKLIKI